MVWAVHPHLLLLQFSPNVSKSPSASSLNDQGAQLFSRYRFHTPYQPPELAP
uniref:Uncharacterized protein n=1 Tax=Arundo donax TaxID=35708 RepID=A0A0A9DWB3_ARUDO